MRVRLFIERRRKFDFSWAIATMVLISLELSCLGSYWWRNVWVPVRQYLACSRGYDTLLGVRIAEAFPDYIGRQAVARS